MNDQKKTDSEGKMMSFARAVLAYKLRAALVSLSVFLVFSAVLAGLAWRLWYPDHLFWTDGGIQGLRLICAVDFVLGPVLALVFFHPEKSRPKLIFDIAVVATIQVAAMVWGAHQVYSQRPLAVVYGSQRFISVAPAIMKLQRKTPADLRVYSAHEPPFVYRREPGSERERQRMLVMLMRHGFHFEAQAWLFQPFRPNLARVFERQAGFREYLQQAMPREWEAWREGRAVKSMTEYRFAFYEGRYENAVLVFSPRGDFLGHLAMGTTPVPGIRPDPLSR
ncbi:MAG: hypothetical protein ACOY41_05220 [Pseudomonadota bacterium]